jgi:hypothetical protein
MPVAMLLGVLGSVFSLDDQFKAAAAKGVPEWLIVILCITGVTIIFGILFLIADRITEAIPKPRCRKCGGSLEWHLGNRGQAGYYQCLKCFSREN